MKIIIAVDSFKGTLSSYEAACAIEKGLRKLNEFTHAKIDIYPIADGGEGTLEAIFQYDSTAKMHSVPAKDMLGKDFSAPFLTFQKDGVTQAVVETASIVGLTMIAKEERDVLRASTYGVGQVIKEILDRGIRTVYLGIGGTATNDAGIGMLHALGMRFLDQDQNDIGYGTKNIGKIAAIDTNAFDRRISQTQFITICDVTNPFYGPNGATYVYGPQKGVTEQMKDMIDDMFRSYNEVVHQTTGIDMQKRSGTGAGGGIGGAAQVFLGAKMQRGVDWMIEYLGLEKAVAEADIVITGEGKTDSQTLHDKLPMGIGLLAKKYDKYAVAISGDRTIQKEDLQPYGVNNIWAITDYFPVEQAMGNAFEALVDTATFAGKEWLRMHSAHNEGK